LGRIGFRGGQSRDLELWQPAAPHHAAQLVPEADQVGFAKQAGATASTGRVPGMAPGPGVAAAGLVLDVEPGHADTSAAVLNSGQSPLIRRRAIAT